MYKYRISEFLKSKHFFFSKNYLVFKYQIYIHNDVLSLVNQFITDNLELISKVLGLFLDIESF